MIEKINHLIGLGCRAVELPKGGKGDGLTKTDREAFRALDAQQSTQAWQLLSDEGKDHALLLPWTGLVAFDCDDEAGEKQFRTSLKMVNGETGLAVTGGRGPRFFFRWPEEVKQPIKMTGDASPIPKVDFLSGVSSSHVKTTGRGIEGEEVPVLPTAMARWLEEKSHLSNAERRGQKKKTEELPRHEQLKKRLAGFRKKNGGSLEQLIAKGLEINDTFDRPKDEAEVEKIAQWVDANVKKSVSKEKDEVEGIELDLVTQMVPPPGLVRNSDGKIVSFKPGSGWKHAEGVRARLSAAIRANGKFTAEKILRKSRNAIEFLIQQSTEALAPDRGELPWGFPEKPVVPFRKKVLDLTTGELRDQRPEDLVPYVDAATSGARLVDPVKGDASAWIAWEIASAKGQPDPDSWIKNNRRDLCALLLPRTFAAIPYHYDPDGRRGKTTKCKAAIGMGFRQVVALGGEVIRGGGGQHSTWIDAIKGKSGAILDDVISTSDSSLNTGFLRAITGASPMVSRGMRENQGEKWESRATVLIATNHLLASSVVKPMVNRIRPRIWRGDRHTEETDFWGKVLEPALPAYLFLLLEEMMEMWRNGYPALEDWEKEDLAVLSGRENSLVIFLRQHFEPDPGAATPVSTLQREWHLFLHGEDHHYRPDTKLVEKMRWAFDQLGWKVEYQRQLRRWVPGRRPERAWIGLKRLLSEDERDALPTTLVFPSSEKEGTGD